MGNDPYAFPVILYIPIVLVILALFLDGFGWLTRALKREARKARDATERARQEREAQLSRERAQSRYATNYAEYLPKWHAWHDAMKIYEAKLPVFDALHSQFVAAREAYRERGITAAKLFETIHENVEKRGRLELELSARVHLTALFQQAIAAAAKAHPDLGLLRLVGVKHRGVDGLIFYNMPELAYLLNDPRLEVVRDLLPRIPPIDEAGNDIPTSPTKPERPPPPEGIIFYREHIYAQHYYESGDAPPVPPDKVRWS